MTSSVIQASGAKETVRQIDVDYIDTLYVDGLSMRLDDQHDKMPTLLRTLEVLYADSNNDGDESIWDMKI